MSLAHRRATTTESFDGIARIDSMHVIGIDESSRADNADPFALSPSDDRDHGAAAAVAQATTAENDDEFGVAGTRSSAAALPTVDSDADIADAQRHKRDKDELPPAVRWLHAQLMAIRARIPDERYLGGRLHLPTLLGHIFSNLRDMVTLVIICTVWMLALWVMLGNDAMSPAGGPVFVLLLIVILAKLMGVAASLLVGFPFVGMLLAGLLLRNINSSYLSGLLATSASSTDWLGIIRTSTLAVILTRCGLNIKHVSKLRKRGLSLILLGFVPAMVEAIVVALIAKFVIGLDWAFTFLLGFAVAPLSPAMVTTVLTQLQAQGYGVGKQIPSLLLAAAGLDNVVAIAGFGIFLSASIVTDSAASSAFNIGTVLIKAPLELLLGLVGGAICGFLLIPMQLIKEGLLRAILLLGVNLGLLFGGRALGHSGSGALAVTITAAILSIGWGKGAKRDTDAMFDKLWAVAQPAMIGLVGASVDLHSINLPALGIGIGVALVAMAVRFIASFGCTFGNMDLTIKERIFCAIAWIPKATVQAALVPMPLQLAIQHNITDESVLDQAGKILSVGFLFIAIAGTVGGALLTHVSTLLLPRDAIEADADQPAFLKKLNKSISVLSMGTINDDHLEDIEMREATPTSESAVGSPVRGATAVLEQEQEQI